MQSKMNLTIDEKLMPETKNMQRSMEYRFRNWLKNFCNQQFGKTNPCSRNDGKESLFLRVKTKTDIQNSKNVMAYDNSY